MVRLDYAYVATWTIREDLRLLMRTVGVVFRDRRALPTIAGGFHAERTLAHGSDDRGENALMAPDHEQRDPRSRPPEPGSTGRRDDARDFSSVYAENVFRVYGFVGYRIRCREETEDLTQLVFEKALRAWSRYDPSRSAVSTWLLAIAKNVLIDHFRRRRETLIGDEAVISAIEEDGAAVGEPGLSPELATAVSSLSSREQTVLAFRFGADLTGREIGELLELSTDNVHQILSRALRKLRETVEVDFDPVESAERAGAGEPQ